MDVIFKEKPGGGDITPLIPNSRSSRPAWSIGTGNITLVKARFACEALNSILGTPPKKVWARCQDCLINAHFNSFGGYLRESLMESFCLFLFLFFAVCIWNLARNYEPAYAS